jgi:hypothetical protein
MKKSWDIIIDLTINRKEDEEGNQATIRMKNILDSLMHDEEIVHYEILSFPKQTEQPEM